MGAGQVGVGYPVVIMLLDDSKFLTSWFRKIYPTLSATHPKHIPFYKPRFYLEKTGPPLIFL